VAEREPLRYIPADAPPPAAGLRGYGEEELIPALKRREAAPRRILSAWAASYGDRVIDGKNRPNAADDVSTEHLTQVLDTTTIPWRFLVNLTIFAPTGDMLGGSGWLLGPRTVITAGHCVFLRGLQKWASRVEVRVARNGPTEPYPPTQTVSGAQLQSVEGWVNDGQEASDLGALLLSQPVSAGSFGINSNFTDAQLDSVLISVGGYPKLSGGFGTLWAESHYIAQVTEDRLYYAVATVDGMSGGPVFLTDQNGNRFAVGIHNYLSPDGRFGIATRINPVIAGYLAQWRALGDGQQ
jgi:V8-like Glu-specific endopeptidase